jgi:hypothetical protein
MEGRGTGTPGGERAARYIANRFARLSLKPLGDNASFLQAVPYNATQILPETSFTAGGQTLEFAKEFVPAPPYPSEQADVSAGLVFVGYGVTSPELKRDDLAGLDLKGKIAVLLGGKPKSIDDTVWQKAASQRALIVNIATHGVAAIVLIGSGSATNSYEKVADYLTRRRVALAGGPEATLKLPPIMLASDAGGEKLFSGTGTTLAEMRVKAEAGDVVSRDLGKPGTIALRFKRERTTGSNVVGVLEGSDPTLKAQAVLVSAHYDAFGRGLDGRIYPGAADNALGVGEMLAMAEAAAKSSERPRRSMVFLAVCGEEAGLLGSMYWSDHPTWPLDSVAADLNFDGIGTEVYGPLGQIVCFGGEYSSLGGIVDDVAASTGAMVLPDPFPEERVFYRSDHYSLVTKGVPSIMLMGAPGGDTSVWIARARTWLDTDYHQTTDVVRPDWDWRGARSLAVLGLVVALRVAAADATPEWLPSSPFKRGKKAAAATSH